MMDEWIITFRTCKVCENPHVEYVNGETAGCEFCHEYKMNKE